MTLWGKFLINIFKMNSFGFGLTSFLSASPVTPFPIKLLYETGFCVYATFWAWKPSLTYFSSIWLHKTLKVCSMLFLIFSFLLLISPDTSSSSSCRNLYSYSMSSFGSHNIQGRSKSRQFCTSNGTGSWFEVFLSCLILYFCSPDTCWRLLKTQVDVWTMSNSFWIKEAKSTTFSRMLLAMPFSLICSINFGKSSTWVLMLYAWVAAFLFTVLPFFFTFWELEDWESASLSAT